MLISTALQGKYIKSSKGDGIIQFADKRNDIYIENENVFAYACKVRPQWNGTGFPKPDFYPTVYVGVDE
jgi:hypothetical protein